MDDSKPWQPLELVKVTSDYLAGKEVQTPRLDAEVLLCRVLGLERRVDLYAGFERKVSGKELSAYREMVRRRAAREPVSRILGRRDFMGLTFMVTPDVLSPRPETEILVEAALERLRPKKAAPAEPAAETRPEPPESGMDAEADGAVDLELERLLDSYAADLDSEDDVDKPERAPVRPERRPPEPARREPKKPAPARPAGADGAGPDGRPLRILDLGTGSGCVAAAVAALLYNARLVATDASPKALAVAKRNAANLGVGERVEFRQGDWFSACRREERFDAVLANPPYLVEGDVDIWPEVSGYDPPLSLYGGRDGLDCYRRIIPEAPEWLTPEGWLFFEVGAGQGATVSDMLARRGFREVGTVRDYGGVARVVFARAPEGLF